MIRKMMRMSTKTTTPQWPPVPVPYGAHPEKDGVRFTLFSRHATRVWLLLFNKADAAKPDKEIELNPKTHRIGDVWHVFVPKAQAGQFYVYRMEGELPEGYADRYDPHQWVLDPYAQAVAGAPEWGDPNGLPQGSFPKHGAQFPKGVIVADDFDWGNDAPPGTPLADSIIYETHIRGYTVHPSAGVSQPGTYAGFMEKIPYLKDLGVTAVEFLPMQEFDEMEYHHENNSRKELRNFWGYSTVNFFSPNGRYAAGGVYGEQVNEFKQLVKALHEAGIEVILDIVFNHTSEGGFGGPIYSFRGIDAPIYYMLEEDGKTYRNFSGCGNTVNCNHPIVQEFILDSLRSWVTRYHVDGFRFDLASVFCRGLDGEVMETPPIVEAISEDPVLRDVKLIAEAWDAAGLYQVGSFPHPRWAEWNGRYRDDVRAFWRGGHGLISSFATRLAGSADLYDRDEQTPLKSLNFITSHDGFTMADVVSYDEKHNLANGEENRDGDNHNHSCNHGVEGPTDDPHIKALRKRQIKNLMASMLLSQGVPMITAGDEFCRTQQGNNNAYCQDNEISWVDWSLLDQHRDLFDFVKHAIAFRKQHPSLRRTSFLTGAQPEIGGADIVWLSHKGEEPNWDNAEAIGCVLDGSKQYTGAEEDKDHLFLIFNTHHHKVHFHVPPPPGGPWQIVLTTEENGPHWTGPGHLLDVDQRSVTVLASAHQPG
jgi:isoamylase